MGFGFSKKQDVFRQKVRDFLEENVRSTINENRILGDFSRQLWEVIGDFGLLGIGLPEEYGGTPGDNVLRGIVAEEVGRVDLSLSFALIPSYGTSLAILHGGCTELKTSYIPGLIKGKKLGSVAMTESDCGSDLSLIRTKAMRNGDHYILKGEKIYVSWGLIADVNWIFAKTETEDHVAGSGITSFLMPLELPGIGKSAFQQMGLENLGHCSLFLEDVQVPVEYMLGEEGKAIILAAKIFPITRMLLSLSALGVTSVSLEEAVAFAKQRTVFGKPLGRFEDIAFLIAEHATVLEAARLLCYRTLWLMDQNKHCAKEIAMSKWWSTEIARQIIGDAMLIYGYRGYSTQFPLQQRFRDIIGYEIAEATPQILKLAICEELLGKELRPFC